MTRHVVFGTGQIGSLVVAALAARGEQVIAVNRTGSGDFAGVDLLAGDAADASFAIDACTGANVVYFCLNAIDFRRWAAQFPPLQRGVLAGARSAGARLVVLDNLYAYGPPAGHHLVETMPARPTSTKSAARAAMTDELRRAHRAGDVEVAIGRASDYFGPGIKQSALGEGVFGAALSGRTAVVMGDLDQPHSYSYAPDVANGLVTLGTTDDAAGHVWHLPVAPAQPTRATIEQLYALAGHRPRVRAVGRATLRLGGVVKPELREYLHTLYQFTDPWIVDDTRFRSAFGTAPTPLDGALATTFAWYANAADHLTGATP